MLAAIPLMLLPLFLYNFAMLGLLGDSGIASLEKTVVAQPMLSGAVFVLSFGDLLIVLSLLMLFFELFKATRNTTGSLVNHMLSLLVFIAALSEFLLVREAATRVYFIVMAILLIDVISGFVVSIRTNAREVSIGL